MMLFDVLVVLGFVFMLVAQWPISPWSIRAAWLCWFIASLIWGFAR